MAHSGRRLVLLLLSLVLSCAPGCFGTSQNPSAFPYWVPFGDVIETHSKPSGHGYYGNFDPHADKLVVEPAIITTQVGSQVVILATVKDAKDVPRRGRRVNWFATGGHILEVDESGIFPGRGGNRGNYAFSYTNYHEHRLSRGNTNKLDDIMLRPGQSWCVVSSPVEGDTHVQVVVPGIYDWDKRVKTALVRWVDVTWEFPPRGAAKYGTEHEFVTKVARHTDRLPLANYRVRYKILPDGPPAMLLPSRAQEQTVITDLNGIGKVRIAQLAPNFGTNRVSVEVIRPPDPTAPSGTAVPIATGETSVDWLAPGVKLSHVGPDAASVGANITYNTAATNTGRLASEFIEMRVLIPEGLEFVGSVPPIAPRDGQLIFPYGILAEGQLYAVQTTFRGKRPGVVKSIALLTTAEKQSDQKEVDTRITTPQLKMDLAAPATALVGQPITYEIRLSNPGDGDLDQILLSANFDKGLEHGDVKDKNELVSTRPALRAGESRVEYLVLTPRVPGQLTVRVTATSAGLTQQAVKAVNVQQPKVSLQIQGPGKSYVGRPAEWKIFVRNDGDVELSGIVVRDRLPAELKYIFAGGDRNATFSGGDVIWNVGTLKPNETVKLELTTNSQTAASAAEMTALAVADGNLRVEKSVRVEIQGIAALRMERKDREDPVQVGKTVVYDMVLTNTGSAPTSRIVVKAIVPPQLRLLKASGPTKETVTGQSVTFEKLDFLPPGAKLQFTFECEALKAGDARFRLEYTSELNATPIVQEEPTTIVAPLGAPKG